MRFCRSHPYLCDQTQLNLCRLQAQADRADARNKGAFSDSTLNAFTFIVLSAATIAYARGPLESRTMMLWAILVDQWRWWFALAYWVWVLVDMVFEISSGPSGLEKGRQLSGKRDVLTPWESSGAKGVPKSHIFETLASKSWFTLGFMHTLKGFAITGIAIYGYTVTFTGV